MENIEWDIDGRCVCCGEMDIFDLSPEEFDKLPTTIYHPKPYYPPKTLDAYVRMTTCGKGYPNGKVPAEVVERYFDLKNKFSLNK